MMVVMARHTCVRSERAAGPTSPQRWPDDPSLAVATVLAVKNLTGAKSRLAPKSTPQHRALVVAMLLDTVSAVRDAGIDRIVLVSPDPTVRDAAREAGAIAVAEPLSSTTDPHTGLSGLNLALAQGCIEARRRWPAITRVVLIQADLPSATATSIREALIESVPHAQAMVTDRSGVGTAMLIRGAEVSEPPRFGADSAAAHRDSGAVELDPHHRRWPDLRTDVDTLDDLQVASALGLGARTAAALAAQS